jgi:hypothetical protein
VREVSVTANLKPDSGVGSSTISNDRLGVYEASLRNCGDLLVARVEKVGAAFDPEKKSRPPMS